MTSWDRIQRLLRARIEDAHYHLGCNFERVDHDERGVRVQLCGGRIERADILVGADGIRSSVRAQLSPAIRPIYAGYYIWRGAERQPIGNQIVIHARKLGTHLGVDLKSEDDRRMHKLLQSDGALLDWIAVPNFLAAYRQQ